MSFGEFHLSGNGEVYSYTTIFQRDDAPEGFGNMTPYTVALIRLDEGPLVTAMMTDLDFEKPRKAERPEDQQVYVGQRAELVTRRLFEDEGSGGDRKKGMIVYGYHARPELTPALEVFSLSRVIETALRSAAHPEDSELDVTYEALFCFAKD